MTLVRCEIHGLVYNDENPRGCPACDMLQKGRESQASMMQELARASQKQDRSTQPAEDEEPRWTWIDRLRPDWIPAIRGRNLVVGGSIVIVTLVITLVWLAQPRFLEQAHPVQVGGAIRPLAVTPGQPVTVVFSMLGTQPPRVHPSDANAERYSYGTDLFIDAINGFVYSISIGVPNRSWRGLYVGMPEREAQGAMSLLSEPIPGGIRTPPAPQLVAGYNVYRSLEARPIRNLTSEVRPPNGCFDVIVEMQPQADGLLLRSGRRYAVVGQEGDPLRWVVTRVRAVTRRRSGPLDTRAC